MAAIAEMESQSILDSLESTKEIRKMWLKGKAGQTFDEKDVLNMAGIGGGFMMSGLLSYREGRLKDDGEVAKLVSRAILGGTVTKGWMALADLRDPTHSWSDRYEWKGELPDADKGQISQFVGGFLGAAFRKVDPYIMSSGKVEKMRRETKAGMSRVSNKRIRQIDKHLDEWEIRIDRITSVLNDPNTKGDKMRALVEDKARLERSYSEARDSRDRLIEYTRAVVSSNYEPKTPGGEVRAVDKVGAVHVKSFVDQIFDDIISNYLAEHEKAGIIPSEPKQLMKIKERLQ